MGYESKLYIVEKQNKFSFEEKRYARVIAMFDLCKHNTITDFLKHCPETDCYFFADDGRTKVLKDKYNVSLKETTLPIIINKLEQIIDEGETYRRVFPLLALLKTINVQQNNNMWNDVVVLHYGY